MVIISTLQDKNILDILRHYFYHNYMGRPPKEKALLMNIPLRIMLTAEQKKLIEQAAKMDGLDMTAWARPILLKTAELKLTRKQK